MDTITVLVLSALMLYCLIAIVNSCRKSPEDKKERPHKIQEEANAEYNRVVQNRFKC